MYKTQAEAQAFLQEFKLLVAETEEAAGKWFCVSPYRFGANDPEPAWQLYVVWVPKMFTKSIAALTRERSPLEC